jgi:ABC-type sugar transport system ATPase subunit
LTTALAIGLTATAHAQTTPENVGLTDAGTIAASIKNVEQLGNSTFVHAECGTGLALAIELRQRWGLAGRMTFRLNLPAALSQIFDADTGLRIRG